MTKNEILVRVRRATEHAWLEMARDLDLRCPRESIATMFNFQENDERQSQLRHAWAALYELLEDVGAVSDPVCDHIGDRASALNIKVFRECKAAEEAKQ